MQIEMVGIEALKPFENNAKTHPRKQVEMIAASIAEFGWTTPILVDDSNTIIAGHARLLAALSLEMKTLPVVRLEHLTDEQARAYRISDNGLADLGAWDFEALAIEMEELQKLDVDLGLTGFEIEQLSEGEEVEDGGDILPTILVEPTSEEEAQKLLEELKGRGMQCRIIG